MTRGKNQRFGEPIECGLLPLEIITNHNLSPNDKIIYSILLSMQGDDGVMIKNSKLMTLLSVTQPMISGGLKRLKNEGLIDIKLLGNIRTIHTRKPVKKGINKLLVEGKSLFLVKPYIRKYLRIYSFINTFPKGNESPLQGAKGIGENELITFWNKLNFTQKHTRQSTQTYKQAKKYLSMLEKGKLSKFKFDQAWVKQNKFRKTIFSKKWSRQAIKNALSNIALLYDPAYWPKKKTITTTLVTVIYNPAKQTSLFLQYAKSPPPMLKDINERRMVAMAPWTLKKIISPLAKEIKHETGKDYSVELLKAANSVGVYWDNGAKNIFESQEELIREYFDFANGEYRSGLLSGKVGALQENGFLMKRFKSQVLKH